MSNDFTQMTGYEFEDYVANLFKRMGFRVTQTEYSGDGGIDMYLYYEKPVFRGKYVVQCKNYTSLVGQPVIRDLYGVVMSESANKGILITTSDFTEQAYAFADGKNLELINRVALNQLTSIEDKNSETRKTNLTIFSDYDHFNRKRYDYLRRKIDNQPSEATNYEEMISFLTSYMINSEIAICQAGLFDDLIKYINMYRDRCFRAKSKQYGRKLCSSLEAELRIAIGDLAEATKLLIEMDSTKWEYYLTLRDIAISLNYGQHKNTYERGPMAHTHLIERAKTSGNSMLKINLLSAFNMLGYKRGENSISKYIKKYGSIKEFIMEYGPGYMPLFSFNEMFEIYQHFQNGDYNNKFFYICQSLIKNKRGSGYSINRVIDGVQNASYIHKNYYIKDDSQIISELDEMFDSLEL